MCKEESPTCAVREENQRLTAELDKVQEGMGKLIEQVLTLVELNKYLRGEVQTLKAENERLKGDDMADAYLKAEGEAADASHWGQVAVFIDSVRQMRAAQAEYFRTRDKDVMRKSIALEKEVDSEIKSNDNVAWVLQYLSK